MACNSRVSYNSLAEFSQFIVIVLVPYVPILGKMAELEVLERLASFFIYDRYETLAE